MTVKKSDNALSTNQKFVLFLAGLVVLGSAMSSILDFPVVSFVIGAAIVIFILAALLAAGALLVVPERAQRHMELLAEVVGRIVEAYRRGSQPVSKQNPPSPAVNPISTNP